MDVSRRTVVAALGAGSVGALAGCGCKLRDAYRISLELDAIEPVTDGWELTVTATTRILNPSDDADDLGSGRYDVAAYDHDRTLLETGEVEPVTWGDVPEANRSESDCGDVGSRSTTETLVVGELPAYVGPRFHDPEDVEEFAPGSHRGLISVETLQYAGFDGSRQTGFADGVVYADANDDWADSDANDDGAEDTNGTADGAEASNASDDGPGSTSAETNLPEVDEWPPESATPSDYETTRIRSLPWPRPTTQAVERTDDLAELAFDVDTRCRSHRRHFEASLGPRSNELHVRWERQTGESCVRPFLADVLVDDGTVTVVVLDRRVPYARCRDCEALGYQLHGEFVDGVASTIDEIVIEHRDDGEIEERIVERLD